MISYNYTLNQQGFASNITCAYDDQSPIKFTPVPGTHIWWRTMPVAPILGLADVLTPDVVHYPTPNTNNTLTFWACKSVQTDGTEPIYSVYLRGRINYDLVYWEYHLPCILNTTCNIPGGVSIGRKYFLLPRGTERDLCERDDPWIDRSIALGGLGAVIQESQNVQSNLVAESVITFGVKDFQLPTDDIRKTVNCIFCTIYLHGTQ
jgi:hypothetical protein